jgi:hypothetical protein
MEEQNKNIILGPRYAVRLRDLREWHGLELTCFKCRHVGTVAPAALQQRWGEHTRVAELEPRMKCTACGNKQFNSWRVTQLPR